MRHYRTCLLLLSVLTLILLPFIGHADMVEKWVYTYNGAIGYGTDFASFMQMDSQGRLIVVGRTCEIEGAGANVSVARMTTSGDTLWFRYWNGVYGDDNPVDMTFDDDGNIYVLSTTQVTSSFYDFVTLKFNRATGDTMWVRQYDSPYGRVDLPCGLAVDAAHNVYVAGDSWTESDQDIIIVKYNEDGDTLWTSRYTSGVNQRDQARAMTIDAAGNVYVVAMSWINGTWDYLTVKFNTNGDTVWSAVYNGPASNTDTPEDILVDAAGNVYVTGKAFYSGASYTIAALIKYNSAGVQQYARTYMGNESLSSESKRLLQDGAGNLYLCGIRWTGSVTQGHTGYDMATFKVRPNTGDTIWTRFYNGPNAQRDSLHFACLDEDANLYIGGASYSPPSDWVQVVKYDSAGNFIWDAHSDPTGTYSDKGRAIVPQGDNVFVAGIRDWDWMVMKLGPDTGCCVGMVGNIDNSPDDMVSLGDLTALIDLLFISLNDPICRDEANVDLSSDGAISLGDLTALIDFLFISLKDLPPCP